MYSKPADVKQPFSAFPSDFVSKEEKLTKTYGLKYVKAIWSLHTISNPVNNPQYLRYINCRQFAEGNYDTGFVWNRLGIEGDTSFMNLDTTSINRIAPIVDSMVGMLTNRQWKLECNPTDTVSKTKFDNYRREIEADMFLKKQSDQLEPLTGTPLVPKGKFIPADDQEKELHLKMNFKLDEAIAMELALKWVLDNNNFTSESVPQIFRDLIETKKTAVFRYYDENRNIRVERWDHLKLITPYSVYPDYKNIPYQALTPTYTIGAIAKMNPGFTDEQLYDIAKSCTGNNNNGEWDSAWGLNYAEYNRYHGETAGARFNNFNITVVNFYFLTPVTKTSAVKISAKGRVKVEEKKDGYTNDKGIEVINKKKLYRMEGYWIPTTEYMWGYKMTENIERDPVPGGYSPECELPCKIIAPNQFNMSNKSLVERMIPFEKQLLLAWCKLQQFLIEAMPPGMAINQDALLDVIQGMGEGKAKPTDWMKLYKQTGSFVFNGRGEDGQQLNMPFKDLTGGISPAFEQFMKVQDYCINKMNEVVGYNTAVDASSPTRDNGLGLNQMAQQATYNCLRPLYMHGTSIIEATGKRLALMIQDSIKLNNRAFIDAIGQSNTDVLTMGKNMSFSSSAIGISLMPDEFEQAEVQRLIELAIANKTLTSGQVLSVRQQLKTDIKLAGQLLSYYESKNQKDAQAQAIELQEQNGQIQIQSAQAASQAQAQLDQVLTQNKIAVIEAQAQFDIQKIQMELEANIKLQMLKNDGANTVAVINNEGKVDVQQAANEGKIVSQQVATEGKMVDTQVKSMSDHAKVDKEHQHQLAKVELEAKVAPKPVEKKK
ncbi:MAG: hypothetical protein V4721_10200 [Bacteroidota bacterium]